MTPPGKSAARRLAPVTDQPEAPAPRDVALRSAAARAETARDKLLAFPGFEPRPPRRRDIQPAPAPQPATGDDTDFSAKPDLGAELEAALMGDLQSMVNQFDNTTRDPAPESPAADPDQQALERLLASIRQGDGAPRPAAPPAEEAAMAAGTLTVPMPAETVARQPAARDAAARDPVAREPVVKRGVASPRPSGRTERMAPPARARQRGDKVATKAESPPPLRLAVPGDRRGYLKPVIAISALILLAALGAGMTIRSLVARNDTSATRSTSATPPAEAGPAAKAVPAAEQAPVAMATPEIAPAPRVAAAAPAVTAPQPQAAMPETPRLAVDRSATSQATAMVEASKPPVAQPVEPAASGFVAAPSSSPLSAAELALQAPVMATPLTAPEPAAPTAMAEPPAAAAPAQPRAAAVAPAASRAGLQPGPGRIASGVKLRTNPDNGAPVIGLLAAGATVEIVSCKGWCEIVAGDKRGFVYQKFLSQAGG